MKKIEVFEKELMSYLPECQSQIKERTKEGSPIQIMKGLIGIEVIITPKVLKGWTKDHARMLGRIVKDAFAKA